MFKKPFWQSKALWVNAIAIAAIVIQAATGKEAFDANAQVAVLAVINLIIRLATDKELTLK